MSEKPHTVEFDRVKFERMASGAILVTVSWPGDMAMLSRSAKIKDCDIDGIPNFNDLRELLDAAVNPDA